MSILRLCFVKKVVVSATWLDKHSRNKLDLWSVFPGLVDIVYKGTLIYNGIQNVPVPCGHDYANKDNLKDSGKSRR